MVMSDMMKQYCLPVKKLLRAFVLSTDSRYSSSGDGGRVVKFLTAFRDYRFHSSFLFLVSLFFFSLCKYVL